MSLPPELRRPQHWLSWFWIGVLRLIGLLPFPVIYALSAVLGEALFILVRSRARITLINLQRCLPELSAQQHRQIARRHFRLLICSGLSIGTMWWASKTRLNRLIKIKGLAHIDRAQKQGHGIILLAPHFVALDAGGLALSKDCVVTSMYQSHKNPVFDYVSIKQRSRFGADLFDHTAPLTRLIRSIRAGKPFYYLPDQNAGARRGIYAPFFGIQASTYPSLGKMAKAGHAVVIPFSNRITWRGIESELDEPMADFPVGDALEDTTRMNLQVEKMVRERLADYLWSHKRFKQQPEGAPDFYKTQDPTKAT